jgi:hypothetical protein
MDLEHNLEMLFAIMYWVRIVSMSELELLHLPIALPQVWVLLIRKIPPMRLTLTGFH